MKKNLVVPGLLGVLLPGLLFAVAQQLSLGTGAAAALSLGALIAGGVTWMVWTVRSEGALRRQDFVAPVALDPGVLAELELKREDPLFSSATFLERAMTLASRLAQATSLAEVHPFVSDGLYQRLSTFERLQYDPRFGLDSGPVKKVVITGHATTPTYDHLAVRLTLSGPEGDLTRALTFLRRRGVKTRVDATATACPHCNAPLELTATQRCRFCEAIVNSGAYDWVLCDVTPGVHQLHPPIDVLDPDGLRALDVGLAPEELGERAAVVFWRWVEGDQRRLGRVTEAAVLPELLERARPGRDVVLASATTSTLRRTARHDEAHVVVTWAQTGGGTSHQDVFVFRRPHGHTPIGAGLSTFRCLTCLAAMTDAEEGACSYCDTPFSDQWRLATVMPWLEWKSAMEALRRQLGNDWTRAASPEQRARAFRLLTAMAQADGAVTGRERALLEQVCARWQLPAGLVDDALTGPKMDAHGVRLPRSLAQALTRELVELAFVDGATNAATHRQLRAVATALGTERDYTNTMAAAVQRLRDASVTS